MVGDTCTAEKTCKGNTKCAPATGAGFCTCIDKFKPDDNLNCVEGAEVLGGKCKNGVGCENIQDSKCSSSTDEVGKCECPTGFHGDDGTSTCTKDSMVGDTCTAEKTCKGNTKCSSATGAGFCTCIDKFKPDDNLNCVEGAEVLGGKCKNGVGCENIQDSKCSSSTDEVGKCECPAGFHGDDGTSTCTKDSMVGDTCTAEKTCKGNTKCSSATGAGFCTCIDKFKPDDNLNCVEGAEVLGGKCKNGVGCENIQDSKCSSSTDEVGKCECPTGFHGDDGTSTCTKDSMVGDTCTAEKTCKGNTKCSSATGAGFCTCIDKFKPDDNLNCVEGAEVLGGKCKNGVGCENIQDSICSSSTDEVGKCECPTGFHGDDGTSTCTKDSMVGDTCTAEKTCNGNTKCSSATGAGFCTCIDKFKPDDNLNCVEGAEVLGGKCKNGVGCENIQDSICSSSTDEVGKCECPTGFHGDDGTSTCTKDSMVGDTCTAEKTCKGNTKCSSATGAGFCTCIDKFKPDDNLNCVEGAEVLGGKCKTGVGCENIQDSKCSSSTDEVGKCECPTGFHGDDGTSTCTKDSMVGDTCTAEKTCNGNTKCSSATGAGFCTCIDKFKPDDNLNCVEGAEVLGGKCKNGVGCENIQDSICSSSTDEVGKCECPTGFHGDDGTSTCTKDSMVGDTCTAEKTCNGNTKCSSATGAGFCTCIDKFKPDDNLNCVEGAEVLGGKCKNGVGCENIQDSKCSSSTDEVGKCECPTGFHGDDGTSTCTKDADSMVGDTCTADKTCKGNTKCSSATGAGFCTCIDKFKPDDNLNCVEGAEVLGGKCKNGVGCENIQDSKCSSSTDEVGKCECPTGFHGDDGTSTCTKDSMVGDTCTAEKTCKGNTKCSSATGAGFCTCIDKFKPDDNLNCVEGAEVLGGKCKNGVGCENIQDSKCSSSTDEVGKCECPTGFHGDDGTSTCTKDSMVGDTCTADKTCKGNTKCSSATGAGFCTCIDKFKPDDNLNCVEGAEVLGGKCKNGVGCENIQDSKCSSSTDEVGKCECPTGFHGDDGTSTCTKDSMVGDTCTAEKTCKGNTKCSSATGAGFCTCIDKFKPDDNLNCVEGAEVLGGKCKNGVGCENIQDSKCSSSTDEVGKCECPTGFHGDDGTSTCTKDADSMVGDTCTADKTCKGNTKCSSATGAGFCTCIDKFKPDDNLNCVEGAEVLGGKCKNGVGCENIQDSKCSSSTDEVGKCECPTGFHGDDGTSTCTKDADSLVGDTCTAEKTCRGNTKCSSATGAGFCTCIDKFKPDDNLNCVEGAEVLGGKCKNGVGCENIQDSKCSSSTDEVGKCECPTGFHGDDGTSTCTKDSMVGDTCTAEKTCKGYTKCSSATGPGFCTCNDGFKPDDNLNCINGAEVLGGPCKNGVGCEQIQNSECSSSSTEEGKCVCSSGFDGDDGTGTCTKVPHLNDTCSLDSQCAYPYGKCVKGMCKCDEQHVEDTTSGLCVAGLHGLCKNDSYCKYPITETCQSTGNSTEVKTCQCKKGYAEDATHKCKAPNSGICDEGGCQDPHAECVPPNKNTTVTSCICKASYKLNKEGKCTGSAISVAFGALVLSLMTILTL
ncbi:multiple epidermal growth factor-like domains protein 6 isoform X3 [Ischnura elegans]|uniref:multiple epidermal growth factor-like domains protein 6 isoform X3 n=1 Tax=Ischnura elegans TaxID=197161 RepID=UPI001ED8685C|nr:multiple epidermal growth factor-like domains protein 6 isoform X3 [Ischnura elegans]